MIENSFCSPISLDRYIGNNLNEIKKQCARIQKSDKGICEEERTMTQQELQRKIDRCIAGNTNAELMLEIAQAYIKGDVIQDKIAAEGWLMRVIDLEEASLSTLAMAYLVRDVLELDQVLSDEDYRDVCEEYRTAAEKRKKELELLLEFGTEEQKRKYANSLHI